MAEEHSRIAHPPTVASDETRAAVEAQNELLEEIDSFEEIEVESAMQTGEHRRPTRTSVPPPVPAHARQSQRPSALPPPRVNEDAAQAPKLETSSPASRPPSHSGMFRIDRPDEADGGSSPYVSLPPAPPPARSSAPPLAPTRSSAPPLPPARASAPPLSPTRSSAPPLPSARASAPPPPAAGASDLGELKRQLAAVTRESGEQTAQIHRLRLMVRLREDRVRELETEVAQQRARVSALEQQLAGVHAVRTADDLKRISGIGPGFERALHAIGVTSFRQIAEWTPADLERVAREIRTTPRRITRDQWVERARELADAEAQASPSEA